MSEAEGTARYGGKYFCIKVPKTVSESGEIYVMADKIEILPCGTLACWGGYRKNYADEVSEPLLVLSLAAGHWSATYAASLMDGSAIAVEHWEGEVVR